MCDPSNSCSDSAVSKRPSYVGPLFDSTARVSAIVPFFNRASFLAECIESILAQTVPIAEIIAIDDGSDDESAEVIRSFSSVATIHYFYQANRGVSSARNLGLSHARGEFIAFLDSDDRWRPDKTEKQLAEFAKHDSLGVSFGSRLNYIDGCNAPPNWLHQGALAGEDSSWSLPASLIRASLFEEVGGFNESLMTTEDIDWFIRARDLGVRLEHLDEVVLDRRIHPGNLSNNLSMEPLMSALHASIKRKKDHN